MRVFSGILAGGSGTRMESSRMPKQFLEVEGIPVLIRTLNTFLSVEKIEKIIIAINTDWKDTYHELLVRHGIDLSRIDLVPGGSSRFASLCSVVRRAAEFDRNGVIVTHDCARIFCTKRIIEENISAMESQRIVTTSIPVIDTILESEDGVSSASVPDRSRLWADQGPQTFYIDDFLKYAEKIPLEEMDAFVEAGKLFLVNGHSVGIVKGDRQNFKITNDIDLQYAEFLIERGLVKA
ncbi:MAG: D-ribitol-5-phosphate cytidylyltransferase [Clostridia bacterium]|nr:D-ribitol-5-phosphate cytidylyltransferase [Clostridia bacterium]